MTETMKEAAPLPVRIERLAGGSIHGLARTLRLMREGRIVGMRCQTCGREWDVANRGRETGFIVAASDSHAIKCSRDHETPNSNSPTPPVA